MTFFGEHVSNTYEPRLRTDKSKVDLLVIIGTSLKVAPVNDMLLVIPPTIPQIWISKERCQREGVKVDIELLGECDVIIDEICRRAGWMSALNDRKWSPEKSSERKASAERPKPSEEEHSTRPPLKKEHSLELRPRPLPSPAIGSTTKTPPKLLTQIDHDHGPQPERVDTKHQGLQETNSAAYGANSNISPSRSVASKKDTDNKPSKKDARTNQEPSRVIIDLEEGTRNRWYVRQAK
jgi:hypothetical protein